MVNLKRRCADSYSKQQIKKASKLKSEVQFFIKIQRWWRRICKNVFINHTDFLTLEPFRVKTFHLKDNVTRRIYRFDPVSLGKYFLQEGNFMNPYTRAVISNEDLARLDSQLLKINPSSENLVERRESIEQQRKLDNEHAEMCNYLHSQCCAMIDKLDNLNHVNDVTTFINAEFHVEYVLLPLFFNAFRELFTYDNDFACDSIHFIFDELSAKIDDNGNSKFYKSLLIITQGKIAKFISDIVILLPVLIIAEN